MPQHAVTVAIEWGDNNIPILAAVASFRAGVGVGVAGPGSVAGPGCAVTVYLVAVDLGAGAT